MIGGFQLAQINIGRLRAPTDSPATQGFMDNLDRVNSLAEAQPGFVCRFTGDGNNAADVKAFDKPLMILNMSVWRDVESLAAFVYRTGHRDLMRRRLEWFHAMPEFMTMWWVPTSHRPVPQESIERLDRLTRLGAAPEAFSFKSPFPAPLIELAA